MRRKPTETVQINLRLKEAERRRLEAAATAHGVTMTAEIRARLDRTFRAAAAFEIDQLAENVRRCLQPMLADAHELAKFGDLTRAADALVDLVQPLLAARVIDGPGGAEIRAAIDRLIVVKRMIEIEAGKRFAKMGTDFGAQQ